MPRKHPQSQPYPPDLQVYDDEWVEISWKGQHEKCCSCGARHVLDYQVVDGKLMFKARRLT